MECTLVHNSHSQCRQHSEVSSAVFSLFVAVVVEWMVKVSELKWNTRSVDCAGDFFFYIINHVSVMKLQLIVCYTWVESFDNQHNHQEQATEWLKIAENLQNCNLTVKYLFNYWVVSYGCVGSLIDKEWLFIVIDSVKRCQEHVSCHQQLRSSYILRRKRRKSKRLKCVLTLHN